MKKNLGLLPIILMAVAILSMATSCKQSRTKQTEAVRPNIIFIMSDDHAYQAISAYMDHLIETPNIDRIASEGML
ncbi:MAG: sulfatase, partial [Bacteroidales bacterium]